MDSSKTTKNPIVLKEENKKYAFDPDQEMRGYVKLELDQKKSLIIVIMDNIKFFPSGEYVYKLLFAGMKHEKRRYHMVGNISLSAYGKGEASFRVNPSDLDGSGMALSDFSTAIIAAMSTTNSREALHPVLKGEFCLPETANADSTPTPKDYSPFYNRFVLGNCIELAKIQDNFEDIVPFEDEFSDIKWKKITDCKRFPMIAPEADAPINKYGHFLFGWQQTHYFLGVPGRFFPQEQPDQGKSGFVYWQPIIGMQKESDDKTIPIEERRKNIYGYWIAAINRYNGHIEEIPLIDN